MANETQKKLFTDDQVSRRSASMRKNAIAKYVAFMYEVFSKSKTRPMLISSHKDYTSEHKISALIFRLMQARNVIVMKRIKKGDKDHPDGGILIRWIYKDAPSEKLASDILDMQLKMTTEAKAKSPEEKKYRKGKNKIEKTEPEIKGAAEVQSENIEYKKIDDLMTKDQFYKTTEQLIVILNQIRIEQIMIRENIDKISKYLFS